MSLNHLTIVSITRENPGIYKTHKSIQPLLNLGANCIIQNGGSKLQVYHNNTFVYDEPDEGIYDAINKAIKRVKTTFFILIHAGDVFIGDSHAMEDLIDSMYHENINMSLNSQLIGKRLHSSKTWRPWMLKFGVQPPHMPTIFRTSKFQDKLYNVTMPTIADFDYYFTIDSWRLSRNDNRLLIQMEKGGKTSNGIGSFVHVSLCFIKTYKCRGILMSVTRIPFKIIQSMI